MAQATAGDYNNLLHTCIRRFDRRGSLRQILEDSHAKLAAEDTAIKAVATLTTGRGARQPMERPSRGTTNIIPMFPMMIGVVD
jgi:hypothetical protein